MFPLAGQDFPTTGEALAQSIQTALTDALTLARGTGVSTTGQFPNLTLLKLNLDGASVSTTKPPPKPVGVGKREPGVQAEQLEISGHPILYGQAKLNLSVMATDVAFAFDRDPAGRPILWLTKAREGKVEVAISKADLQTMALEAATTAAKPQGVAVQDLQLDLTSDGPRSLAVMVRVKAKKMMMSGVIHVSGRVDIDDELNATLSTLKCRGEGIVGGAAAGILQNKLAAFEGKRIPLMAFSLGEVKLRDLKIELTDSVRITATADDGQ